MSVGGGAFGGTQFGINLYYLLLVVISIPASYYFLFKKIKVDSKVKRILIVLGLFVLYSGITAITNPILFEGISVISPRGGIDSQVGNYSRLSFSTLNIGQSVYLILNFLLIVFVVQKINNTNNFKKIIYNYIYISVLLVVFFTVWQILNKWFGIYYPSEYLFSTLERGQVDQTMSGFFRINGPMREPSDLGTILVSFLTFSLLSIKTNFKSKRFLVLTATIIPLIIVSTSSVGIGVAGIIFSVFFFKYLLKVVTQFKLDKKALYYTLAILAILILVYINFQEEILEIISLATLKKTDTSSFKNRLAVDLFSFNVLLETYFLGAGLGSNRPSSFIVYIISNLGIIGLGLFIYIFYLIIEAYLKYRKHDTYLDVSFTTLIVCLIAKSIVGPDLSTEYFWVFFSTLIVNLNLAGMSYKSYHS